MKDLYDFFERLKADQAPSTTGKSVSFIEARFFEFVDELYQQDEKPLEGGPPFSHFADWVARKYGKSKKSLYGRWTKYAGGWRSTIEEQYGSGEQAYDAFFSLLAEFRLRKCVLKKRTKDGLHLCKTIIDTSDDLSCFEALVYAPDGGCNLVWVFDNGRRKVEGFYSTLDDLLNAANKRYKVPVDSWQTA